MRTSGSGTVIADEVGGLDVGTDAGSVEAEIESRLRVGLGDGSDTDPCRIDNSENDVEESNSTSSASPQRDAQDVENKRKVIGTGPDPDHGPVPGPGPDNENHQSSPGHVRDATDHLYPPIPPLHTQTEVQVPTIIDSSCIDDEKRRILGLPCDIVNPPLFPNTASSNEKGFHQNVDSSSLDKSEQSSNNCTDFKEDDRFQANSDGTQVLPSVSEYSSDGEIKISDKINSVPDDNRNGRFSAGDAGEDANAASTIQAQLDTPSSSLDPPQKASTHLSSTINLPPITFLNTQTQTSPTHQTISELQSTQAPGLSRQANNYLQSRLQGERPQLLNISHYSGNQNENQDDSSVLNVEGTVVTGPPVPGIFPTAVPVTDSMNRNNPRQLPRLQQHSQHQQHQLRPIHTHINNNYTSGQQILASATYPRQPLPQPSLGGPILPSPLDDFSVATMSSFSVLGSAIGGMQHPSLAYAQFAGTGSGEGEGMGTGYGQAQTQFYGNGHQPYQQQHTLPAFADLQHPAAPPENFDISQSLYPYPHNDAIPSDSIAAIPSNASTILSTLTRRSMLLPREEIVNLVATALLQSTEEFEQTRERWREEMSVASSQHIQVENLSQLQRNQSKSSGTQSNSISVESRLSFGLSSTLDGRSSQASPSTSSYSRRLILNPNDNNVIIYGMGGMGKTTLAAMATSRTDILHRFGHGIAWIKLGQYVPDGRSRHRMPFPTYKLHLESLCRQLDISPRPQFFEEVLLPGDDEETRERKKLRSMENAKQDMCNLLVRKNVLIVLDDVWHMNAVSWFNFSARPGSSFRILVTTRLRGVWNDCRLIDLTCLSADEAIMLLLHESGRRNVNNVSADDRHLCLQIVKSCGCIPVAVRAAGRLGGTKTLKQLADTVSELRLVCADNKQTLFGILDRSFQSTVHGTTAAFALKKCFASFALVFTNDNSKLIWVPVQTIDALWGAILLNEEKEMFDNASNRVTIRILDTMEKLGLVDSKVLDDRSGSDKIFYRIHHDLLHQYGSEMIRSKQLRRMLFQSRRCSRHKRKSNLIMNFVKSKDDVVCCFHAHIVHAYKDINYRDTNDEYALLFLPRHIIKAHAFKIAEEILLRKSFVQKRLSVLGTLAGTIAQINDVELLVTYLRNKSRKGKGDKGAKVFIEATFEVVTTYLQEKIDEASEYNEIAQAYVAMGNFLQHQSLWFGALRFLADALDAFRLGGIDDSHPLVEETKAKVCASSLPALALVPLGSPQSIKLKNADMVKSMLEESIATDKNRDNTQEDSNNGFLLEFSSHPELGLVSMQKKFNSDATFKYVDVGIGPKQSGIKLKAYEGKLVRATDGAIFASLPTYNEGDGLMLVPSSTPKRRLTRGWCGWEFIVNKDGGISPKSRPNLEFGFGNPGLLLVSRDSPNRVILKHARAMRENSLSIVGMGSVMDERKIFNAELSSHPGHAIVRTHDYDLNFGPVQVTFLGIGPIGKAINLSYDGRLLADANSDRTVKVKMSRYFEGNRILFFRNVREKKIWKGGGHDFVINDDGSISPMHATHLALGSCSLGITSELVSLEQKKKAQSEAKIIKSTNTKVLIHELKLAILSLVGFRPSKMISPSRREESMP